MKNLPVRLMSCSGTQQTAQGEGSRPDPDVEWWTIKDSINRRQAIRRAMICLCAIARTRGWRRRC